MFSDMFNRECGQKGAQQNRVHSFSPVMCWADHDSVRDKKYTTAQEYQPSLGFGSPGKRLTEQTNIEISCRRQS